MEENYWEHAPGYRDEQRNQTLASSGHYSQGNEYFSAVYTESRTYGSQATTSGQPSPNPVDPQLYSYYERYGGVHPPTPNTYDGSQQSDNQLVTNFRPLGYSYDHGHGFSAPEVPAETPANAAYHEYLGSVSNAEQGGSGNSPFNRWSPSPVEPSVDEPPAGVLPSGSAGSSTSQFSAVPLPDPIERLIVGSQANIEASVSKRKKQPKYFCDVPGCPSQGFTQKHNLECKSNRPSG
ncbi:hypothetical protein V5O48_001125 [Marasmius crinis-equi]|uniref:Uncharacterized protein n=1 Tax=Marasmius crinis-equi TaxID=585013 RepID=A0ABR3FZI6_9AGAR